MLLFDEDGRITVPQSGMVLGPRSGEAVNDFQMCDAGRVLDVSHEKIGPGLYMRHITLMEVVPPRSRGRTIHNVLMTVVLGGATMALLLGIWARISVQDTALALQVYILVVSYAGLVLILRRRGRAGR